MDSSFTFGPSAESVAARQHLSHQISCFFPPPRWTWGIQRMRLLHLPHT
ncbi:MAG: hypothetical protein ACREDK_02470 [Thermoplasmata archaeon]